MYATYDCDSIRKQLMDEPLYTVKLASHSNHSDILQTYISREGKKSTINES